MNKEQAKAWLPLIQAVAEGKTLQSKTLSGRWVDSLGGDMTIVTFKSPESFRIKPEPKKQWCRMYLVKGAIANSDKFFYSAIAINGHIRELEDVEKSPIFVRWLTDRIEYELPEGEA